MKQKTPLQMLINNLTITGNIHAVMEAKKFLEYEKNILLMTYISGQVDYAKLDDNQSNHFFNQKFEQ